MHRKTYKILTPFSYILTPSLTGLTVEFKSGTIVETQNIGQNAQKGTSLSVKKSKNK